MGGTGGVAQSDLVVRMFHSTEARLKGSYPYPLEKSNGGDSEEFLLSRRQLGERGGDGRLSGVAAVRRKSSYVGRYRDIGP